MRRAVQLSARAAVRAVASALRTLPQQAALATRQRLAPRAVRAVATAARRAPEAVVVAQRAERSGASLASLAVAAGAALGVACVVGAGSDGVRNVWAADMLSELKASLMSNYENRIRMLSTPEKVFSYFASVTRGRDQFMTPEDFLRSLIPFATDTERLRSGDNSIFLVADSDGDGLISFSEYMFFTRLLSTTIRDFEIAFKMFDLDGNGELDPAEFEAVLHAQTRDDETGRARQLHGSMARGLTAYFFGKKRDRKLSFDQFAEYLRQLQETVLRREYDYYNMDGKGLTPRQFALYVVSHSRVKNVSGYLARIETLAQTDKDRISFDDFRAFQRLLRNLDDLRKALKMVRQVDRKFSQSDLQRAAFAVIGVRLSQSQLNALWHVFDRNGDGDLDDSELLKVLKHAKSHSLDTPRDTGFTRALSAMTTCIKSSLQA